MVAMLWRMVERGGGAGAGGDGERCSREDWCGSRQANNTRVRQNPCGWLCWRERLRARKQPRRIQQAAMRNREQRRVKVACERRTRRHRLTEFGATRRYAKRY